MSDFLSNAKGQEFVWLDTRNQQNKIIRFFPDRSLEERLTTSALTIFYNPVKKAIIDAGRWVEASSVALNSSR